MQIAVVELVHSFLGPADRLGEANILANVSQAPFFLNLVSCFQSHLELLSVRLRVAVSHT